MSETKRILAPTTIRTDRDGAECCMSCGGFITDVPPRCEFFGRYLSVHFTDPADGNTYSIPRCQECLAPQEVP